MKFLHRDIRPGTVCAHQWFSVDNQTRPTLACLLRALSPSPPSLWRPPLCTGLCGSAWPTLRRARSRSVTCCTWYVAVCRWGLCLFRGRVPSHVRMTTWCVSAPSSTDTGLAPLGRCCEQLMPHAGPGTHGRCRPRAPEPACLHRLGALGTRNPGCEAAPVPPTQSSPSCKSSNRLHHPRGGSE